MATLASLKLITAKKSSGANPVQQRRDKLSVKILEQIDAANTQKTGDVFAPTRTKYITNQEGERVKVSQIKRFKPWWFPEGNKIVVQVRYGAKTLMLNGKSNAIECANIDAVISALEIVNAAVLAGDLDAQIEAVSGQIRTGFQR